MKKEEHEKIGRDVLDAVHHLGVFTSTLSIAIDGDLTQTSLSPTRKELAHVT